LKAGSQGPGRGGGSVQTVSAVAAPLPLPLPPLPLPPLPIAAGPGGLGATGPFPFLPLWPRRTRCPAPASAAASATGVPPPPPAPPSSTGAACAAGSATRSIMAAAKTLNMIAQVSLEGKMKEEGGGGGGGVYEMRGRGLPGKSVRVSAGPRTNVRGRQPGRGAAAKAAQRAGGHAHAHRAGAARRSAAGTVQLGRAAHSCHSSTDTAAWGVACWRKREHCTGGSGASAYVAEAVGGRGSRVWRAARRRPTSGAGEAHH